MLERAAKLLGIEVSHDIDTVSPDSEPFEIEPGVVSAASGAYSFASFELAVSMAIEKSADAICTMPIHKTAWSLAGIKYKGHTDALRDILKKEAIMMLGCPEMYVGLYTEHIPLKDVPGCMNRKRLARFLCDFQRETGAREIAVLGLNPHAGDNGVLGDEEEIIKGAIEDADRELADLKADNEKIFFGPLVPDTAFTPAARKKYRYYVAMYHDQGLIPLKALYFKESINVSLNLPVLRTSVDHGTAFDIAYGHGRVTPDPQSYLNALRYIADHDKP